MKRPVPHACSAKCLTSQHVSSINIHRRRAVHFPTDCVDTRKAKITRPKSMSIALTSPWRLQNRWTCLHGPFSACGACASAPQHFVRRSDATHCGTVHLARQQSPFPSHCRRCCCPTMMMRRAAASSPCACASTSKKNDKLDNKKCAAPMRAACSHTVPLLWEDNARHADALCPLKHASKYNSSTSWQAGSTFPRSSSLLPEDAARRRLAALSFALCLALALCLSLLCFFLFTTSGAAPSSTCSRQPSAQRACGPQTSAPDQRQIPLPHSCRGIPARDKERVSARQALRLTRGCIAAASKRKAHSACLEVRSTRFWTFAANSRAHSRCVSALTCAARCKHAALEQLCASVQAKFVQWSEHLWERRALVSSGHCGDRAGSAPLNVRRNRC